MNHKQEEIVVNNKSFMVDEELKDTILLLNENGWNTSCLLYTSPSPRD